MVIEPLEVYAIARMSRSRIHTKFKYGSTFSVRATSGRERNSAICAKNTEARMVWQSARDRSNPRKCDPFQKSGEEVAATAATRLVRDVIASPGAPLDSATREFFESRFKRDFSGIRIHTDTRGLESAVAMEARAYSVGRHIAFGPAEYQPNTTDGRRLIAHELSHGLQEPGDDVQEPLLIGADKGQQESSARISETDFRSMNDQLVMQGCPLCQGGSSGQPPMRSARHTVVQRDATREFSINFRLAWDTEESMENAVIRNVSHSTGRSEDDVRGMVHADWHAYYEGNHGVMSAISAEYQGALIEYSAQLHQHGGVAEYIVSPGYVFDRRGNRIFEEAPQETSAESALSPQVGLYTLPRFIAQIGTPQENRSYSATAITLAENTIRSFVEDMHTINESQRSVDATRRTQTPSQARYGRASVESAQEERFAGTSYKFSRNLDYAQRLVLAYEAIDSSLEIAEFLRNDPNTLGNALDEFRRNPSRESGRKFLEAGDRFLQGLGSVLSIVPGYNLDFSESSLTSEIGALVLNTPSAVYEFARSASILENDARIRLGGSYPGRSGPR